jgi:hypothetical protein
MLKLTGMPRLTRPLALPLHLLLVVLLRQMALVEVPTDIVSYI